MGRLPTIERAIPKRRYQVGEYGATLLGEIESADPLDYAFILAFVREGEGQPTLFVCSEVCPPGEREQGSHRLRLINRAMSEVMDTDDRWRDLDAFAEEGLQLGMQALGLSQETPFRLS
jgi:hypothetical protein